MELKKNPKADLENHNKIFFLLGVALTLVTVFAFLEWKTDSKSVSDLTAQNTIIEEEIDIPVTDNFKELLPPPPPPKQRTDEIDIVDDKNEIEEAVIGDTETDEDEHISIADIEEVLEEAPVDEDIPFVLVEEVPTFPGCTGSNEEKSACFQANIRKIVSRYFNTGLANDLGLSPGKKRVYVQFKIDKNGDITRIQVRAPHKRLEKEAVRVMGKIPKLIPGKQRNRPVGVVFTLPITLIVE